MAHIPRVGRNSVRMRLLLTTIYLLLTLGAITMVYPFLIMLGASVTSEFDNDQYKIVPSYLISDSALFGKYVTDKYSGDLPSIDKSYQITLVKFRGLTPPSTIDRQGVERWRTFVTGLPRDYVSAGFRTTNGEYAPSFLADDYQTWLRHHFHDNIHALDVSYEGEDTNFLAIQPPIERLTQRMYRAVDTTHNRDWAVFKTTLPEDRLLPVLCDPLYSTYLHDEVYSGKIELLNKAWGTSYSGFQQIILPERVPSNPVQAKDWTNFVRTRMPLRFVAILPPGTAITPLPSLPSGPALMAYSDKIRSAAPGTLAVASVENLWRDSQHDPNAKLPLAEDDWLYVQHHQSRLRTSYLERNYLFALNFLLLHGRGIWNTVIFCGGAVVCALIINPLCAYALSRFRLPYSASILLFLLATMAFPGEVAMIPNFLLLKQLHLLNTFYALILPGAASGFSIFLLKGFFDSLPKELYEAGMIDGASELTLFRLVTLPLSTPIFAVIALQAFSGAYGAFLFAMIVCQAQSHWTLMVWIYEFQALNAPQYVQMAALVIAALPTLIVFLFAQKVIMRGIILPSFK